MGARRASEPRVSVPAGLHRALHVLVTNGMVGEARDLIRRSTLAKLPPEDRDEISALLRSTTRVSGGVFFPLIDDADEARDLRVQVIVRRIAGDVVEAVPDALEASSRYALRSALDAAWRHLDGAGARPRVSVSMPLLEEALTDRRVSGPSLYLASFLAAVGCFGEARPVRNVLATGDPDAALGLLARKRRLRDDRLGISELLAIGAGAEASEGDGLTVTRCEDLRHAIASTFRAPSAFRFAEARGLHAYCGVERRHPPGRFSARAPAPSLLALDAVLTSENFAENLERVVAAVPPNEPVELSLAATVCFAAALGNVLSGRVRRVRFIDASDDAPWWSTMDRPPASQGAPHAPRDAARVLVTCHPERAQAGWQVVQVDAHVHRELVSEIVARVLRAVSGVDQLAIAFDTPLALAFAVGVSLRRVHTVLEFWHFTSNTAGYARMFTVRREGA
jgi:hypothetical protein